MSTPTGQARQGSDSTDKLILKTNAWRIILNRKLTFRRRYLYNLYIKWSSSSFYCLMATISLSLFEPPSKKKKNSTTFYGVHFKRLLSRRFNFALFKRHLTGMTWNSPTLWKHDRLRKMKGKWMSASLCACVAMAEQKKIESLIGEECSHATRGETAELRDEPRQIALLGV